MPYKKHDLPLAWLLSCQCVRSGWCYSGVQNQSTCRHLHNSNSLLTRFTASLLRHRDVAHDTTRLIILVQMAAIQHDILEKYKFPTYFRSWMSSSVIISSAWWLFNLGGDFGEREAGSQELWLVPQSWLHQLSSLLHFNTFYYHEKFGILFLWVLNFPFLEHFLHCLVYVRGHSDR